MAALIAASAVRTCFGDGDRTFAGLLRGRCGAGPLRHGDPDRLGVTTGYHAEGGGDRAYLAGRLLEACLSEVIRESGVDTARQRVTVLVATGLRELAAVESWAVVHSPPPVGRLDFTGVVAGVLPGAAEVITFAGACSAGGYALGLAQDMVEHGEADVVVVAAADGMTESMLAMIGQVGGERADRVRPFDRDRAGVLLGDGAAAVVVTDESWTGPALGRLVASGLSCDAFHVTAPDLEGICRATAEAYHRAGRDPSQVDLVVAHGTGTALNDPVECEALRKVVLGAGGDPLVTGVKGALGHTSGAAALVNLDVALQCLATAAVPPVVGLREPLAEGTGLRFVRGAPARLPLGLVQLNAFGFGGVNAVTLVEAL
ncbi:beta-ketoacyl synthase N-terminal-like domain-containing protein [Amycolatopsis suaedae]|uniref:Beta-ketoacyl synthase n=1 Tax=Amycolatopsis suaedae TaxID=2510978 RepID=A0A4Q7J421_9PSEU|nr:beta-ketoacyl synthase N-terminal-like domain-containing protein [Amycolatopsis suaedae]RZQ61093.1 beta-ketoacyl synthase [Amycolatopsis suaedae]